MSDKSESRGDVGVGVAVNDTGAKIVCIFERIDGVENVIRLTRTRSGVDTVIRALERCKLHLPEEPAVPILHGDNAEYLELGGNQKDDASNLPPMSNRVEGGGHFGLS